MNATALGLTMTAPLVVASTAPAKINLTLNVLGRRDDGFHELRSLIIGVDLCDRVRCRRRDSFGVDLVCSDHVLDGPENLSCRAAEALAGYLGREPAVAIDLDKRIPVGGGMGGGSSDAATTLRLCDRLWEAGLDDGTLVQLGADIGSDVPLFFSLPAAVLTGRGERVEPMTMRWSGWVLLVSPGIPVSTADVYRAWRPTDSTHGSCDAVRAIAEATSARELSAFLFNDLERAVFRVAPAVATVYGELNRAGVGPMRVTGAGSTMYRLFDDREAARRAAARVMELRVGVTVVVVAAPVGSPPIVSEEC